MAKSEALAFKNKISRLENQLKNTATANASAGGSGNAEAKMEVEREGRESLPKELCLVNGVQLQLMGDQIPLMKPPIYEGLVVRQPEPNNRSLTYYENIV